MSNGRNPRASKARHSDFIGIPRSVANEPAFTKLTPIARALYVDLRRQHTGYNNGSISAVLQGTADHPGLASFGWAERSIFKNLKLITGHGLMEKTRQGGIGAMSKTCSLYAFTDLPVVANKEKGIAGSMPSLAYRNFVADEKTQRTRQKKSTTAPGAAIAARGAASQLHAVPTHPLIAARGAASNFGEKDAQGFDAQANSGNSDARRAKSPQLHRVQSLINLPREGAVNAAAGPGHQAGGGETPLSSALPASVAALPSGLTERKGEKPRAPAARQKQSASMKHVWAVKKEREAERERRIVEGKAARKAGQAKAAQRRAGMREP